MRWGDLADEFLKLYPHATDEEAARSNIESTADGTFWHMRLYADYQVKKGNKAYLYFFAQNPPATDGKPPFPAAHAAEVPYVFNNLGQLPYSRTAALRSVGEVGAGQEGRGRDVVVLGELSRRRATRTGPVCRSGARTPSATVRTA